MRNERGIKLGNSIVKITGIVWIVSWFSAIWIYHLQFFLTGLFSIILSALFNEGVNKLEKEVKENG